MLTVKFYRAIITIFTCLQVLSLGSLAKSNQFELFINGSLIKSGSSVKVSEGSTVIYEISQPSDLPIELDLTGQGNLIQKLTGKIARFVTAYNHGNYNPKITVGTETKSFFLSVSKQNPELMQFISKIAWPVVLLIIFIVLFFWGGLSNLLKRFSPTAVQIGEFRIEASEFAQSIKNEIEKSIELMNKFYFSREISTRFMPTSLTKEISYYIHVFEFLDKIGIKLENAHAWNIVGTYYSASHPEKAEEAYKRAIALDPDEPTGYANLGMFIHLRKQDLHSARKIFIKATEVSDRTNIPCPIAYMGLASVYKKLKESEKIENNLKKAISEFQNNLAKDSSDFWSHFGLAWCFGHTNINLDKSIESSLNAVKLKKDFYPAWYNLACYQAKKKNNEESIKALKKILVPAIELFEEFGFKYDRDFLLISSEKTFEDFRNFIELKYAPKDE